MSTLKNSITMNPHKYWDDMEFSENIWKSGVAEGVSAFSFSTLVLVVLNKRFYIGLSLLLAA